MDFVVLRVVGMLLLDGGGGPNDGGPRHGWSARYPKLSFQASHPIPSTQCPPLLAYVPRALPLIDLVEATVV